MKLEKKILIAFAAGAAAGSASRITALTPTQPALVALEPIGTVFIRLVTMVVVPLVIASVFVGVASLGDIRSLGRLGGKTLGYFLATTVAAAVIGLSAARIARLGEGAASLATQGATTSNGHVAAPPTLIETLVNLVPQNPFASAAQGGGDLLPLIIAVCIFGAAATVLDDERRRVVLGFFQGINDLSMVVIGWVMRLAPVAVFALIAATIARSGLGMLDELAAFALVVVAALLAHTAIVLLPALLYGARVGVRRFARAVSDAVLVAFSTAASNVALPVSMAAARERLGVPQDVVSFVLPAGASLNKNGSAAYKAVAALFIAHLYGMSVTNGTLLTIALMATVAAFAGAGVPGSSLVTTLIVLDAIGLGSRAAAGIALVAAVDRPLDMCRSAVNTISNLVGAAWVARSEARLAVPVVPVGPVVPSASDEPAAAAVER